MSGHPMIKPFQVVQCEGDGRVFGTYHVKTAAVISIILFRNEGINSQNDEDH